MESLQRVGSIDECSFRLLVVRKRERKRERDSSSRYFREIAEFPPAFAYCPPHVPGALGKLLFIYPRRTVTWLVLEEYY